MHPEKEARIKTMINEYKELEYLIVDDIFEKQTRLHEHRRRREILEAIVRGGMIDERTEK